MNKRGNINWLKKKSRESDSEKLRRKLKPKENEQWLQENAKKQNVESGQQDQ